MATYLETLPAELKQTILLKIDFVNDLRNLIHACPTFHATYLASRERILTALTLKLLERRRVNLLEPRDFLQIYAGPAVYQFAARSLDPQPPVHPQTQLEQLEAAIQCLYDQINTAHSKQALALSVEHCLALHSLRDVIGWEVQSRKMTAWASIPQDLTDDEWLLRPCGLSFFPRPLPLPRGVKTLAYMHWYRYLPKDYEILEFGAHGRKSGVADIRTWLRSACYTVPAYLEFSRPEKTGYEVEKGTWDV